jgi:hypothetical protein
MPVPLHVSSPVPPLEHVQDWVVFGVQTEDAVHCEESHAQLLPEQTEPLEPEADPVMQPLVLMHQPHAFAAVHVSQDTFVRHGSAVQSVQALHPVPALLQACVPTSPPEH